MFLLPLLFQLAIQSATNVPSPGADISFVAGNALLRIKHPVDTFLHPDRFRKNKESNFVQCSSRYESGCRMRRFGDKLVKCSFAVLRQCDEKN